MKSASCFSDLECEGYRNINEIISITDRLHMCETLFGDPDAELLLLGQDGAPFRHIAELANKEGDKAYRHSDVFSTNNTLRASLEAYVDARRGGKRSSPKAGGVFFANAIWLLKDGEVADAPLRHLREAIKVCRPVLRETITGLPNLKVIMALGKVAYQSLQNASPGLKKDWRRLALSGEVQATSVFGRRCQVATTFHPGSRGAGNRKKALPQQLGKSGKELLIGDIRQILETTQLLPRSS